MTDNAQMKLPLIPHKIEQGVVQQRAVDGYIDATAMCKNAGKSFADYGRLGSTKAFIAVLSSEMGIPISELIQVIKGGIPELQGTWIHPHVAINLAQWLSPKFAVLVSKWVFDWMTGGNKSEMPYHLQRYMANRGQIPHTHFSVLNELTYNLVAPLESLGYTVPEHIVPDISEGIMFANWLRKEKGFDLKDFPKYTHRYLDGRTVEARLYPNELLADFRKHFNEVWLPKRANGYFQEKDPAALPHLKEVLRVTEIQIKEVKSLKT